MVVCVDRVKRYYCQEALMEARRLKTFLIPVLCGIFFCGSCFGAEVTVGPYVHFYDRDEVTIFWKTDTAVSSRVDYGVKPDMSLRVEETAAKTDHELVVSVKPETLYNYRVMVDGAVRAESEFYSTFDYGPEPFPAGESPYPVDSLTPLYEQAADYIVGQLEFSKGTCIDYGCGEGRLAYEIAKRTDLKIIGFEVDPAKVTAARNYLDKAGIYGSRVTILNRTLTDLKCRDYSANLIVSDRMISEGSPGGSVGEMFRILVPDGGTAILGRPNSISRTGFQDWLGSTDYEMTPVGDSAGTWAKVVRPALSGAGKWTHIYADLTNSANSGELGLASSMKVQWYGQPGPRYVLDRHNRPMPSLYNKGIVVTPGANRIMAYDAYNGSRYWDMSIPQMTRAAVLRDTGWMAMADDLVYVAHKNNCVGLDLKTGKPTVGLTVPQLITGQTRHWGYLGIDGDNIIGSAQKDGASLNWKGSTLVNEAYWDNRVITTSDYLFCQDRHSGETLWTYRNAAGSVIVNAGILVAGDYVYFLESINSNAVNDADGRVQPAVLMQGTGESLVKVHKITGAVSKSSKVDLPFANCTYLVYSAHQDLIIAVGSRNTTGCQYEQVAFRASDLSKAWASSYYLGGTGGSHGEQDQHPCVVGGTMYMRHYKVQLANGAVTSFGLSRGNCGTQSACPTHLFGRNGNPQMYTLPGGSPTRLTNETRPGCWINMIPAGGMLLIPESSSGCTCDFSIQATMTFVPK